MHVVGLQGAVASTVKLYSVLYGIVSRQLALHTLGVTLTLYTPISNC